MTTKKRIRSKNVLERLEQQLKSGVKTEKKSSNKIPLTEHDKYRITNEIQTLKTKLKL
jgi:hypothetical protein